jgi:hypothetical protein
MTLRRRDAPARPAASVVSPMSVVLLTSSTRPSLARAPFVNGDVSELGQCGWC